MSLSAQRAALTATLSLAACFAAAEARAGDSLAPLARPDAHCRSHGDGFVGVAGSDACIRISGYIDAGADFATPRSAHAPLVAPPVAALRAGAATALDTRFDTPAGPGRVYIEIGRPRFAP